MNHRIARISVGEITPDEYHGGTGRRTQQYRPGDVFGGQVLGNEGLEDHFQKKPGDQEHGEGFHQPVDYQGNHETFGFLAGVDDAFKVHFQHHGINHQPDENRYRY